MRRSIIRHRISENFFIFPEASRHTQPIYNIILGPKIKTQNSSVVVAASVVVVVIIDVVVDQLCRQM